MRKIKSLDKAVKDLDGIDIGGALVSVDALIDKCDRDQLKPISTLMDEFKKLKDQETLKLTYGKLYEQALFVELNQEKEPSKFLDSLEIATRIRKNGSFSEKEIDIIRKNIPKLQGGSFSAICKAVAIKNLNEKA